VLALSWPGPSKRQFSHSMAKQIACACLVDKIGGGLSLEVKRSRFQNVQVVIKSFIEVSTSASAENLVSYRVLELGKVARHLAVSLQA
jgi:hypothetical protein